MYKHAKGVAIWQRSQLNTVYNNVNNHDKTYLAFLDLSKAFDSISHKMLLAKLGHLGMNKKVLKWFESYLENRKQCVFMNGLKWNDV